MRLRLQVPMIRSIDSPAAAARLHGARPADTWGRIFLWRGGVDLLHAPLVVTMQSRELSTDSVLPQPIQFAFDTSQVERAFGRCVPAILIRRMSHLGGLKRSR